MFAIIRYMEPLIILQVMRAHLANNLQKQVANNRSLSDHRTGGRTLMYRNLPAATQDGLAEALKPELDVFGYETDITP